MSQEVPQAASVKGCLMCDSLYVKANGELPCWDDVGEELILGTVNESDSLFHSPALVEIRKAFLEGRDPHPEVCSRCAVRGHGIAASLHPRTLRVLHIEPCYLCQLACPQCIAPKLRLQLKGPPYYMSPSPSAGGAGELSCRQAGGGQGVPDRGAGSGPRSRPGRAGGLRRESCRAAPGDDSRRGRLAQHVERPGQHSSRSPGF